MAIGFADIVLSEVYHSIHSAIVQIRSNMFGIRASGFAQARACKGSCPYDMAHIEMQSMGWQRI